MTAGAKMPVPVGRLKRVQLKATWGHEAHDFTPWLARNLDLLEEVLERDLELVATEQPVGSFRADLLCRTGSEGSLVLVENQFGKTDHSHLGQLLTYVAGTESVTVVWIAEEFRDEHRAALDWLNAHTPDNVGFFGLELQLWQIGDSPLAPRLNVVSRPNVWSKVKPDKTDLGDTAQLQLEYWTAFREYVQKKPGSPLRPQKPGPYNWYEFSVGHASGWVGARVNTVQKALWVGFFLRLADRPTTKAVFRTLAQQREAIEAEVQEDLVWNEKPDNDLSSVTLHLPGEDVRDRARWPQQHKWLFERLMRLHQAFAPRLTELKLQAMEDG